MGLSAEAFGVMTVAEFVIVWIAWNRRQSEIEQMNWERTRYLAYINLIVQVDEKSRRPMVEMLPLPWDDPSAGAEAAKEVLTMEERLERVRRITGEGDNENSRFTDKDRG